MIADSSSYYTRVTDGVKKRKAPPLLLEKWSLLLSSTKQSRGQSEGWPFALWVRLLVSACFVNHFAGLTKTRMEKRGPGKQNAPTERRRLKQDLSHPGRRTSPRPTLNVEWRLRRVRRPSSKNTPFNVPRFCLSPPSTRCLPPSLSIFLWLRPAPVAGQEKR